MHSLGWIISLDPHSCVAEGGFRILLSLPVFSAPAVRAVVCRCRTRDGTGCKMEVVVPPDFRPAARASHLSHIPRDKLRTAYIRCQQMDALSFIVVYTYYYCIHILLIAKRMSCVPEPQVVSFSPSVGSPSYHWAVL